MLNNEGVTMLSQSKLKEIVDKCRDKRKDKRIESSKDGKWSTGYYLCNEIVAASTVSLRVADDIDHRIGRQKGGGRLCDIASLDEGF